jgi:deoxyribodipyrimidine photo-lyase
MRKPDDERKQSDGETIARPVAEGSDAGDRDAAGLQLVWLKRDIRISDHAPLTRAAASGRCVAIYVYEPELLTHPTTHARHLAFVNEALRELEESLTRLGGRLITRVGDLPEVFDRLHATHPIARLWSHEETGVGVTYARDRRVKAWAKRHRIEWVELPNHGVFRPHPHRDGWARRWRQRMSAPLTNAPTQIVAPSGLESAGILAPSALGLGELRGTGGQRGGEAAGHAVLDEFLFERGHAYQRAMSSPVTAWESCSRLSPYLAWGQLSMRQVWQATLARRAQAEREPAASEDWPRSLAAFAKRLHWHCHFIQKLEDEPEMEYRNLSRATDGLRPEAPNEALLEPWRRGMTGYPLVDACMRALEAEGWINFRMRAMLMSFASYHLWQHWRAPALHLARLFLDFEPGIHFSQAQMQSGTTGINAIRIYSPVKQARDQDPDGQFIRRWCPELAAVPAAYLPRPETMPLSVQEAAGCRIGRDYPRPIVDNGKAYLSARRRMQALRASTAWQKEAESVYERHGSRRRPSRRAISRSPR